MTVTRTAVEELRRHIELAQEALSVSDHFETTDPVTVREAMSLTAQLKKEIADMESELGELERRPSSQVERFALSRREVASYRPDTRDVVPRRSSG